MSKEEERESKYARFNYEKVIKQIQYSTYPASLGMISIGLYEYIKLRKTTVNSGFANPELFFFVGACLFFFASIVIGLGIGEHDEQLKQRQAFLIALVFFMAMVFDLLGLMVLVVFA